MYLKPNRFNATESESEVAQSCPTLQPVDCSPPSSSVHGILQARILEWVAISFSNARMYAKSLQSCLTLCKPKDYHLPGFSVCGILQARILEWVSMPFSRGSSDPEIEPESLTSPALVGEFFITSVTWDA